jgi:hypothetical protein
MSALFAFGQEERQIVRVFVLGGGELCDALDESGAGSVDAERRLDRPDIFSHGEDLPHDIGQKADGAEVYKEANVEHDLAGSINAGPR